MRARDGVRVCARVCLYVMCLQQPVFLTVPAPTSAYFHTPLSINTPAPVERV